MTTAETSSAARDVPLLTASDACSILERAKDNEFSLALQADALLALAEGRARVVVKGLLLELHDVMGSADADTGCDCPDKTIDAGGHLTRCWKFDFLAARDKLTAVLGDSA